MLPILNRGPDPRSEVDQQLLKTAMEGEFKAPPPKFRSPPPKFDSEPAPPKQHKAPPVSAGPSYAPPDWSASPPHGIGYEVEVLKGGQVLQRVGCCSKAFYTFGRLPTSDFVLDHPSSSRLHCVLQFRQDGASFLFDNNSTHGSFVNKRRLKPKVHAPLRVGDVVRFGQSSRLYVFGGPAELMPQESNRAPLTPAARSTAGRQGSTAGPGRRGEEEEEEAVGWRDLLRAGKLTGKQEAAAERILKKENLERNVRSEMERIAAKRATQTLTAGQEAQLAKCHERCERLAEEIEMAARQLESSIAGPSSAGAGGGEGRRRRRGDGDDADAGERDEDDDFYDRTAGSSKRRRGGHGGGGPQVESFDSLRRKMEDLASRKRDRAKALEETVRSYREGLSSGSEASRDGGDPLDAYLRDMKGEAKRQGIFRLQGEVSELHLEMQAVARLMRLADPTAPIPELGEEPRKVEPEQEQEARAEAAEKEKEPAPEVAVAKTREEEEAEAKILAELGVLAGAHGGGADGAGGVGGGDHRAWAPPQGQTGDGTTALNERFGY